MPDIEKKRKSPEKVVALFIVFIVLVMIFPVFGLANSATPIVMGLPLSLFWVVFWIIVEFFALVAFFRYEYGR